MTKSKLNAAERKFVVFLIESNNATDAYRKSHSVAKLTEEQIGQRAYRLKNNANVKRALEAARKKASQDAVFDVQDVLREWADIFTADVNELMSYQRRCCRHCYGIGHAYQWTDANEYAAAVAKVIDENRTAGKRGQKDLPELSGGVGFDFTLRPHLECTNCRGEGHGMVVCHDTTMLSGKARKLYAGVQQTQHGIKILTRDQDAALANFAKALGIFTDKLEVTGKDGAPIEAVNIPLPTDPVEAAKIYQAIIKGREK
jgi:phage terminase small subunit